MSPSEPGHPDEALSVDVSFEERACVVHVTGDMDITTAELLRTRLLQLADEGHVNQVLSLEVASRLSEYATLKAMGYRDRFLSRVVLGQAFTYALVSYVLAVVLALGIYQASVRFTKLPVAMTWERAGGVFVLTLFMCSVSGLLTVGVVRRADPAELFR